MFVCRRSGRADELAPSGVARRIFVPLSGKSVDVRWLAEQGHDVVACELVGDAVRAFFEESGVTPSATKSGPFDVFNAEIGRGRVTVFLGDVLLLEPALVGAIDAVFDRAALIALSPEVRPLYAKTVLALLGPSARMLLVAFEHDAGVGPPYSVSQEEVEQLYAGRAEVRLIEREDVTAESPHMVAKGATSVRETVYLLTFR